MEPAATRSMSRRTMPWWLMPVVPVPGERGRYWVRSRDATPYLVDLEENKGQGWCQCVDWETRRGPAQEEGKRGPAAWCKHVKRARWWEVRQRVIELVGVERAPEVMRMVRRMIKERTEHEYD